MKNLSPAPGLLPVSYSNLCHQHPPPANCTTTAAQVDSTTHSWSTVINDIAAPPPIVEMPKKGKRRTANFSEYSPMKLPKSTNNGRSEAALQMKLKIFGPYLVLARFVNAGGYHPGKQESIALLKGLGFTGMKVVDPNGSGIQEEIAFYGFFEDPTETFTTGPKKELVIDNQEHSTFADLSRHYNSGVVVTIRTKDNIDFQKYSIERMAGGIAPQIEAAGQGKCMFEEIGQFATSRLLARYQDFGVIVGLAKSNDDYDFLEENADEFLTTDTTTSISECIEKHRSFTENRIFTS